MSNNVSTSFAQAVFVYTKPWKTLLDCADFVKTFLTNVLEKYIVKQQGYGRKPRAHFYTNIWPTPKNSFQIGYKLNSRPQWAIIPLKGISNIINH